jgi:hypothetical protein
MQDFGSQISGLEEQISKLMEQMGVLEAEKNAALQKQDVMRAELAQAQQDALTEQASQFEGVKSSLEQQIADLTAQIGNTQTPTDTPTLTKDVRVPGISKKDIDYGYGPGIMPPLPDDFFIEPDASMPTEQPSIGGIKNPDGTIRGSKPPSVERTLERLPSGPRRQDFMSIDRLGKDAMDILPPMPSPVAPIPPAMPPMTPPMTPRPRPRPVPVPQPMTPSMPMPQPMAPTIRPDMTMMGGARGGFSGAMRPMMMRAGGGGISKAIVDLQSRLK